MALVAGIMLTGVQAQALGPSQPQPGPHVLANIDAGKPQDLIVVYDDLAIEADARAMQTAQGLSARHPRIVDHKAARYASQKQASLANLATSHAKIQADTQTEVLKDYRHLPVNLLRVHTRQALERLLAQPGVTGVYENRIEQKMLAQSLPLVGQPQVAAQGSLGTGSSVAVLDTGVDYTRAALGGCSAPGVPASCKVVYAQDFAPDDGQLDSDGHGTNVAAVVAGVAPGTKIVALDVFGASGTASSADILSAISWVIANRASYNIVAINLSLGSGAFTSPVTSGVYNTAVAQARAAGILTVAAAGNDGYTNALSQPAAVAGVVSVGAVYDSAMGGFNWGSPLRCSDRVSAADKVTCFSNSASFLTLLAPGSQISAAGLVEGGTSQAAPHVAGAVAVLRAAYPTETLEQTVARLTNGVLVTDGRNDLAKPRINLPQAMGVTATSCNYSLSALSQTFDASGGNDSVNVSTDVGCSWQAASDSSNASWITVTAGASGSGNASVSYTVAANPNVAGRTGTLTVAGKTYTVTQSGSVSGLANLLLNPGFEAGAVTWVDSTANGYPVITADLNPVDAANSWYAWLCGYNRCTDTLYQDVVVPPDAQTVLLQFKYWVQTTETDSATVYDDLSISIADPAGTGSSQRWTLSNLNVTSGWLQSPQYDVSAFRGQTIRVKFAGSTDGSFATDFLLDDVQLLVSGSAPDTQPPTLPGALRATVLSSNSVRLSWSPATDNVAVSTYQIYRNDLFLSSTGNVLGFTDTALTAASSYRYSVAACDAAGNCTAPSLAVLATTPAVLSDVQAPTVPTGLTGRGSSVSALSLSWLDASDNVGVSQYKLYRNGTLLQALVNVTSYADSGLTPSTSYSYTVAACDAAGNCSAQSPALAVSTLSPFSASTPLIIDGAVSVNTSGNLATISIGSIVNRSDYLTSGSLRIELWAFDTPFTGSELGYKTASIRTSAITGGVDQLAPYQSLTGLTLSLPYAPPPAGNTQLVVFVTEYSATCTQVDKFCYAYYVNLHETQAPTIPGALAASAVSSSQIDLVWADASDNVGVATYQVYRNGALVAVLGNVTRFSDVGLAAAASYSYRVTACDAVANCSAQSASATATTPVAPDTHSPSVPSGLTATVLGSSQVTLTWNAATDNTGVVSYNVYSSGALVATLGNVTSTTRATAPATRYSYSVSACDAVANCSGQSVAVPVTTPALADTTPPSAPTNLIATPVSQSAIDLSWAQATDDVAVTQYKVVREGSLLATLGNVSSFADTGLRAGTAYRYSVQACDALANCSVPSAAASATTVAPSISLNLAPGWNLLGNSSSAPIDVASALADASRFITVWKWHAQQNVWGFYAPALAAQRGTVLADYAASKGYQLLSTLASGEGFWVNATGPTSVALPAGGAFSLGAAHLLPGWNLVVTGDNVSPKAFNLALTEPLAVPPSVGGVPINLTTLWAWDNGASKWYFYAPNLEGQGGTALFDYTASKGYLDFASTGKLLGAGLGFWVNRP
ncbi:MAG: S8 family serine peptidase [Rhodoferax sp.]|nr:S8 family serine peptidase [Rhodoferax sp.]